MAGKVITVALNPCIDKTVEVCGLQPYGLNRVLRSETDPGGKGVNVARVLRSFGADVTVTGFVAGDTGRALTEALKKDQISADFMELPGETRVNLKVFDSRVREITEINEPGCPVEPASLEEFTEKLRLLLTGADTAVLCGSLPPKVPADIYARFIALAKRSGVRTILDAAGDALSCGLREKPYAVKPNIHELEALMGRSLKTTAEILSAARSLIRGGVGLVIVSMGADGAVVADAKEAYKTDVWKIEAKSATGAGDSMAAVLADALQRGAGLAEIARAATAAGTVTASKPGTQLCTRDEVLSALPLVTLHAIDE